MRILKDKSDYSSVHGSQATSTVHHNGTHNVRGVNATWKCTFPDGNCFQNHAPTEGMPDKMQECIKETSKGPLQVEMDIDLHCAKMDNTIHCDSGLPQQEFDPFATCSNDPNLLQASCHFLCKGGYPFEKCVFTFDSIGAYSMNDTTIESCQLQAECSSPYVEANSMFCSSHRESAVFKPHWESRPLPKKDFADHGIRGPTVPTATLHRAPVLPESLSAALPMKCGGSPALQVSLPSSRWSCRLHRGLSRRRA
jgi:hypothetical protein